MDNILGFFSTQNHAVFDRAFHVECKNIEIEGKKEPRICTNLHEFRIGGLRSGD